MTLTFDVFDVFYQNSCWNDRCLRTSYFALLLGLMGRKISFSFPHLAYSPLLYLLVRIRRPLFHNLLLAPLACLL